MESTIKSTIPSETLSFVIQDITYSVDFPNTGELIDIENKKASLKPRNLDSTDAGIMAYMIIEAFATFSIICPKLIKDLNIDFFKLPISKSMLITRPYIKEYLPWFNEWIAVINKVDIEQ